MDVDGGDDLGMDARGPEAPVPEVAALDPDTQVVVRSGGRVRLALGGGVVVAIVAAGLAVLASWNPDEDGTEALQGAQDFVAATDGYRFEQLAEMHVSTGDPDGAGTDTTTRSLQTGTVAAPDRWHLVDDSGDEYGFEMPQLETIRVGDQIYSSGFNEIGSKGPAWVAMTIPDELPTAANLAEIYGDMGLEEDDPYADEMRLALAMQAYLSNGEGDPTAVTRVITEATDPVVEEERGDGGVLLRARLAPAAELAKLGDIPSVDVVLQLDADQHPVQARFTAEAGTASADVTITFSEWSSELVVEPPAEADIDRTPWLTEEALATVRPSLLLAPTAVPAPMELVGASVFDGSMFEGFGDDEELEPCPSVSFTYGTEADLLAEVDAFDLSEEELAEQYEEMDYLDVTVSDPTCAPEEMFDRSYFTDELAGHPASGGDGYWELLVGDVMVTVSSTLEDDAVSTLVSSLQPTSVDAIVAAIPSWVAEGVDAGAGHGGFPMAGMGGIGFAFG